MHECAAKTLLLVCSKNSDHWAQRLALSTDAVAAIDGELFFALFGRGLISAHAP